MAETRKHKPRTSAIGDAVREKLEAVPRPVSPGDPAFDPFFYEDPSTDDQPADDVAAASMLEGNWISWASTAEAPEEN